MDAWAAGDGVAADEFVRVLRGWLGPEVAAEAATHPIHALERGELAVPDFERQLAARLQTRDGNPVPPEGLLARMFSGFRRDPVMVDAVRRVRSAGFRTGLLSNSWSMDYPREDWQQLFDVTVVSGEVGMRKPEPRIYRHTAAALGVDLSECVFIDDLPSNVAAALDVGMVAIRHRDPDATIRRLEELFGVTLRVPASESS